MRIQAIYTDGACSGNPGPGGWGVVAYLENGDRHELGGADSQTTNNRMELQAAIAALELLLTQPDQNPISVYTDSEYVKNGITKWIKGWKRKNWKTSTGKPVLNQDLWEILDNLQQQIDTQSPYALTWEYVRGHSGNVGNDRCDAIARAFATGKTPQLQQIAPLMGEENLTNPARHISTDILTLTNNSQSLFINNPKPVSDEPYLSIPSIDEPKSSAHQPMSESTMSEITVPSIDNAEGLPREIRVTQLRHVLETLQMADEFAKQGYLITSSELADLMDVNASAVTSRGDNWVWRNWVVSRVQREGNQILWQLERVD